MSNQFSCRELCYRQVGSPEMGLIRCIGGLGYLHKVEAEHLCIGWNKSIAGKSESNMQGGTLCHNTIQTTLSPFLLHFSVKMNNYFSFGLVIT